MKPSRKWLTALTLTAGLLITGCNNTEDQTVLQVGENVLTDEELYDTLIQEPMGGGYTYGERIVKQHMVALLLEMEYGDQVTPEMVEQHIQEAIDVRGGEEEYDAYLAEEGFTREYMETNARNALLYDIALYTRFPVDEDELQEMFERQIPVGTRVAHILVEEKALAESIIEQLEDGADFNELLKEHTLDEGSISRDGQYTIVRGSFYPTFKEASLALKRDEITSEPIKSDEGYHVIKSISEGSVRTFEQSKETLIQAWYRQLFEKNEVVYETIVYDLVEKHEAAITIASDRVGDIVQRILADKPSDEPIMDTPEAEEDIEILFQGDSVEEFEEFLESEFEDMDTGKD